MSGLKEGYLWFCCNDYDHLFFWGFFFFFLSNRVIVEPQPLLLKTYITHNATQQRNDTTGGYLLDYMQLPLEPQKALYCFFHKFSGTSQDL